MGVYTETVADTFSYATDWKEATDDTAPSNSNLSNDSQEATLVGYVPWNKQRSAARHFLGFTYADSASPYRLHREAPAKHPIFPWLYCESVSFTPFIPLSNEDHDTGSPVIQSIFDDELKVAYYDQAICTVRYRNFRCRFLTDEDVIAAQDEWKRWAYLDLEPKIEALQVTGGLSQLTFAEGGGANQPKPGPAATGSVFGAPMATLLAKTGFSLVWLNVPFDYLSDNSLIFRPAKILARVGTVNSEPLLNGMFDAGTMLLQPPRFVEKRYPVAAETAEEPLRSVDVLLNWEFFDPERGATGTSGATTIDPNETRGHNLMPWSGDGTLKGDGKFYLATRGGATTDTKIIPATDHRKVFEHVFAP